VDNGCLTPVPNGESIAQFKARCCKVFAEILERLPAESTTAFVIHGGCIMAILEACAEPKRDFYFYHIPNGAYLRCSYQQGYLFIQGVMMERKNSFDYFATGNVPVTHATER
jgi:alpha-ribazole phosphatase